MAKYSEGFSYYQFLDNCLLHDTGDISVAAKVKGAELFFNQSIDGWEQAINLLPKGAVAEIHLVRDYDGSKIDQYLDIDLVRDNEMIELLRKEHAEHLRLYAMANHIYAICTKRSGKKAKLQSKTIFELRNWVNSVLAQYCDAQLIEQHEFEAIINFSTQGERQEIRASSRFILSEQLALYKPCEVGRGYRVNNTYYRSGLLYLYPNAQPGWIAELARLPIKTHISSIIKPLSVDQAEKMADVEQRKIERFSDDKNLVQRQQQKSQDNQGFVSYVLQYGLSTYRNAYYISIFGDMESVDYVDEQWYEIQRYITQSREKGRLLDDILYALPAHQYIAPAQGHLTPFLRIDHSEQVMSMLPIHQSESGAANPTSIRLSNDGTVFGWSPVDMQTPHAITVAKTGAGKGVDAAMEIVENYAQGINHAILEIGNSYQWLVEFLGGKYLAINPDSTCINPLPTYDEYDSTDSKVQLIGSVIQGLAFLLTHDESLELNKQQSAGANQAITSLYEKRPDAKQPMIKSLMYELQNIENDNASITVASKQMGQSLDAFLKTQEGLIFNQEDNFDLNSDIVGVDLKNASQNPNLLRFYIVFIALKYQAKAFSSSVKTRIVLDEIHKFSAEMPEVFAKLVREITRMGRKDGTYVQLITQNLSEISSLDSETINSTSIINLLYRRTEHENFAEQLELNNKNAIDFWRNIDDPEGQTYRQGLRIVNNWIFDQYLTFGKNLLLIADTSDKALAIKAKIKKGNPLDQIAKLEEALSA